MRLLLSLALVSGCAPAWIPDFTTPHGFSVWVSETGQSLTGEEIDYRFDLVVSGLNARMNELPALSIRFHDSAFPVFDPGKGGETNTGVYYSAPAHIEAVVEIGEDRYSECHRSPLLPHEFTHYILDTLTGDCDSDHLGPEWSVADDVRFHLDCDPGPSI